MKAVHLGIDRLHEIVAFYGAHGVGLRGLDPSWAISMMENGKLHIVGLEHARDLIGVAWIAEKLHNILFQRTSDAQLVLRDLGPFVDSGGWVFRKDIRQTGLLRALAITVEAFWFEHIDVVEKRSLWGRVTGTMGSRNSPLFWELVGEPLTGLRHEELWSLPLGDSENVILEHWPKQPIPIEGEFARRWHEMAHKPRDVLAGVERTLIKEFGFVPLREFYVVQSLGLPFCASYDSAHKAVEGSFTERLQFTLCT